MELRVLGPMELHTNDRIVGVGAPRQRAVLALLLAERGRPVSTERLIDELWAGGPPPAARITVQSCVYRLRKLFSSLDLPVELRTRSDGYVVEIPHDSLDLDRFNQAVTEGRQAWDAGKPAQAASAFETGLELWRGETAFAGVDLSAVRGYASQLEELRLDTMERYLAAELAVGHHAMVTGELEHLTRRYPAREPLWRLRMLALARSGRKADALDAFQQLYRQLNDDFGVQPSESVRELHHQILTDDPAVGMPRQPVELSTTASPPAVPARSDDRVVPRMLPMAIDGFTGRAHDLEQLDALLPAGPGSTDARPGALVISAVSGMAGVGKTALAVHWAHRVAHLFPDGQLYVNLRGFHPSAPAMTPGEAVRGLLEALQPPGTPIPHDFDGQVGLYRSLLADRRALILLDNARDSQQVRPLLPGSPECLVVVTSRSHLAGLVAAEAAKPLLLDVLTEDEARELLTARLGPGRIEMDWQARDAIVAACARLPLALALSAARAAAEPELPLHAIAAELTESANGLDRFSPRVPDADVTGDVRAVFACSYRQLRKRTARMFRLLGLHPGPDISVSAVASLTGHPRRYSEDLLSELTGSHLLTQHQPGRFTLHDLLRAYSIELARGEPATNRRAAIRRTLDHYLHTAHAADRLLEPARDGIALDQPARGAVIDEFADTDQALRWFIDEREALLAAVRLAETEGLDTHAWQLPSVLATFLNRRGYWRDQIVIQETALRAAARADSVTGQMRARGALAYASLQLQRYADADEHLRLAQQMADSIGDRVGTASALRGLALVNEQLGDLRESLRYAEQAENLLGAVGHATYANAVAETGWYQARLGNQQVALSKSRAALELLHVRGGRPRQAAAWNTIGYVNFLNGRHQDALASYRQALDRFVQLGDRYNEAITLEHIGDTNSAIRDEAGARAAWQVALDILEELGHGYAADVSAKLSR